MNNIYNLCFIYLCLGLSFSGYAQQKNWKQLKREAEAFEQKGDLTRAAIYYESAFNKHSSNLDLAYKAGDCYLQTRDYNKAVKHLAVVKGENGNSSYRYPGLKYAIALKQMGEYEKASTAFRQFKSSYNGSDKQALSDHIDVEIQGCNFAQKASKNPNNNVSLSLLSPSVNSDDDDFAAIPFRNILYFSSTDGGTAKMYVAKGSGQKFNNRQEFELSKSAKGHFCNGSFSPDGMRFYFTQCEEKEGQTYCSIYVSVKENNQWSNPAKLPNYINPDGYSTTQPHVVMIEDQEILYFSSNRSGGKGGFDIWYSSRFVKSKGQNFTLPKNLGHNINTDADEVTPFYEKSTGVLYFSSNGHISAGGFDIFKSKGGRTKWEVAQNLGFPYNSSADDTYYISSPEIGGGYITSNRTADKVTTSNDNIFFFGKETIELVIKGKIYAENDPKKLPLSDVNVQLFEWVDGSEELLEDRMLAEANYKFNLQSNRNYLVVINAEGFQQASFEMTTDDITTTETKINNVGLKLPGEPIEEKEDDPYFVIVPEKYNTPSNPFQFPDAPVDATTKEIYESGSKAYKAYEQMRPVAERATNKMVYWGSDGRLMPVEDIASIDPPLEKIPAHHDTTHHKVFDDPSIQEEDAEEGVSYIIQVSAVRKYKPYKYVDLEKGQLSDYKLEFEKIEMGLTRVLVVPKASNSDNTKGFKKKTDALNVLYHILNHTRFTRAFVIRYKDGKRDGEGFRGLDEEAI